MIVLTGAASPLRAAGPALHDQNKSADAGDKDDELTPEQKFQKRHPHPVLVHDLIGLPLLDGDDSTIGYVKDVVRSPEGKVALIVPYSPWLGWLRTEWRKRTVAVPIEAVAILARQINALDMSREDFDEAESWEQSKGTSIPPQEKTLIGLGRR